MYWATEQPVWVLLAALALLPLTLPELGSVGTAREIYLAFAFPGQFPFSFFSFRVMLCCAVYSRYIALSQGYFLMQHAPLNCRTCTEALMVLHIQQ